jgi:hypothetical protein
MSSVYISAPPYLDYVVRHVMEEVMRRMRLSTHGFAMTTLGKASNFASAATTGVITGQLPAVGGHMVNYGSDQIGIGKGLQIHLRRVFGNCRASCFDASSFQNNSSAIPAIPLYMELSPSKLAVTARSVGPHPRSVAFSCGSAGGSLAGEPFEARRRAH